MGNLYFTVKGIIKPSKKSLIETLACLSGCEILDESTGRTYYPHGAKHKLIFNNLFLPEGAPEDFLKQDFSVCWNDLNKMHHHGVIAYKMLIPFRKDFTDEQNMKIITDLVMDEFVSEGRPVQVFVHDSDAGKHAHLIVAGCRLDGEKWIAADILDFEKIRMLFFEKIKVKRASDKVIESKKKIAACEEKIAELQKQIDKLNEKMKSNK